MKNGKLRVALVGVSFGAEFVPIYLKHPDVDSLVLVDTDRAQLDKIGDKFLLEAELPGFHKEDISLDLKEGILTIKAEHKDSQDQKNDKGEYIRRERRYGSFARTFDVSGINESGITAAYNNGILEVTLPKQAPVVPESRQIAIL